MSAALRVFWGDLPQEEPRRPPVALTWDGDRTLPDALPPIRDDMPLSAYFCGVFLPLRLLAAKRSDKTVLGYFDALRYAVGIGGDVALRDVSDLWLAKVRQGLESATYRRSRILQTRRALSADTQAKHCRALAAIVRQLGPEGDGVLGRVPRMVRRRTARAPRPCYTVAQLRQIVAVAVAEGNPRNPDLWRGIYGTLFYTGLRRSTALALSWENLRITDSEMCFDVDGALNFKTGKALWLPAHPTLAVVLRRLWTAADGQGKVLPWPHCHDWLLVRHRQYCQLAGVEGAHRDLHAIRRTMLGTRAMLALKAALRDAQEAAQHTDLRTTTDHYVSGADLLRETVPELPALWE